ncbi:MAG: glycosyltransferase, partial [Anaerolineae bacterium]|nr:glycosyltransferase [Anaerolineae bacterium]
MNILQVSNGFPPTDRGGVEIYTLALSKMLRSIGHHVAVFCREPGEGWPIYGVRDEVIEDIPVRFIVNRFYANTPLAPRYYDRQIEALFARWVEEQQPDVIHFQHTHGLSASLLARAAKMDIPFVMTLHD